MRKLLGIGLALALVIALAVPALAVTTTVYDNDQAGWEAAVGSWATENFDDGAVGPGISVVSTNGYIYTQGSGNKLWYDSLTYSGGPTAWTTWTFDVPIVAFGGTWDLGSSGGDPNCGGPGSNIEVLMDGSWINVGVIDRSYINVFWGFVSDTPFTAVRLQAYNGEGWTERYTLDDMVYSFTELTEVEKHWSETDVCFADGLYDEDPGEMYSTGTPLTQLEAKLKKDKVLNVTPGQFYAVSTVEVLYDLDSLVIYEKYADVIEKGIGVLNPMKGGGKVVVVKMMEDALGNLIPVQILDAMDPEVVVTDEAATITLQGVKAGDIYKVYVKFSPALKGADWEGEIEAINYNCATAYLWDFEQMLCDEATIVVVEKVPE